MLGAVWVTGSLGGAATHVRIGDGRFPMPLPVLVGAMACMPLLLR